MKGNIKIRKRVANVKGMTIEFDERYMVDSETGEEIFDRNIEIENDERLYDLYKKEKGLLTVQDVKSIRKKYGMTQKEYALAIGVGEVTVNRFENGSIQTESVDSIMRLSDDPDNMAQLLEKNKNNFDKNTYQQFLKTINELQVLKKHSIANYNICDFLKTDFKTVDVSVVALHIIKKYNGHYDLVAEKYEIAEGFEDEYITPLKLQKLLYYVQGLSLHIFDKPAFNNKIVAWTHGPVVTEIYQKYKSIGGLPLISERDLDAIPDSLDKIIEIVVSSYGQIESEKLIELTHEEEPWKKTRKDAEISHKEIKNYFDKVYEK